MGCVPSQSGDVFSTHNRFCNGPIVWKDGLPIFIGGDAGNYVIGDGRKKIAVSARLSCAIQSFVCMSCGPVPMWPRSTSTVTRNDPVSAVVCLGSGMHGRIIPSSPAGGRPRGAAIATCTTQLQHSQPRVQHLGMPFRRICDPGCLAARWRPGGHTLASSQ